MIVNYPDGFFYSGLVLILYGYWLRGDVKETWSACVTEQVAIVWGDYTFQVELSVDCPIPVCSRGVVFYSSFRRRLRFLEGYLRQV